MLPQLFVPNLTAPLESPFQVEPPPFQMLFTGHLPDRRTTLMQTIMERFHLGIQDDKSPSQSHTL